MNTCFVTKRPLESRMSLSCSQALYVVEGVGAIGNFGTAGFATSRRPPGPPFFDHLTRNHPLHQAQDQT